MTTRGWLGFWFLVLTLGASAWCLRDVPGMGTLARRLADGVTSQTDRITVRFEEKPDLNVGDPLFSVEDQAFALQGRVNAVEGTGPWLVHVTTDPTFVDRLTAATPVTAMNPSGELAWIVRTLLPPDLRKASLRDLKAVWESQKDRTLGSLREPVLTLLSDVGSILSESLPGVLADHEAERTQFLVTFRDGIYEQELRPILEQEVQARLEIRLEPIAGQVGAEIWDAVSAGDLMAVGWIATKDVFGAAGKEEMAQRLAQLLRKKALPIIKRHVPRALAEATAAVREGLAQPETRAALERTAQAVLDDPAFQNFVTSILDEWIVHNERLRARLTEAIGSEVFRKPIDDLYRSAEPMLEKALEEMLARPDRAGMDHQLVRVLRRVVLKKDKRYLVAIPKAGAPFDSTQHVLQGVLGRDP